MFRLVLVRKPVAYFFCDPLQTKILQRHAAGIDRAELDDVAHATDQHIVNALPEHNVVVGAFLPGVISAGAEERAILSAHSVDCVDRPQSCRIGRACPAAAGGSLIVLSEKVLQETC